METDRYTIDEKGVLVVKSGITAIGQDEFKDFDRITKAVLPRTIKYICHGAFHGCKRLRSINLPAGLRFIESWAFAGCESLTSIDIPEGVKRIETQTFYKCTKLKTVNLPSTLEEIKDEAFSTCTSLKQIVVPDGAEMICKRMFGYSWSPFKYCDALEKVIIRELKPRVSKTEIKKVVLIEKSQYHSKGRIYGAVIGVEPGDEIVEYAREVVKDLLFEAFRHTARYLDLTDWSGDSYNPAEEMEFSSQRFAVVDIPKGAAPHTRTFDGRTYLTDEAFCKSLMEGTKIEWMPLVKK